MGLPGRTSPARILLLAVVLSGLALAPRAALAGVVDNRRTPLPGSATLPVRGPWQPGRARSRPGGCWSGSRPGRGSGAAGQPRPPSTGGRWPAPAASGWPPRVTWSGATSSGALLRGRFS
jgi:hypothetical protein